MKVYIISIAGVGSGNLAVLLKRLGHDVRGSELSKKGYYPPISDLLEENEIQVDFGFHPDDISPDLDLVVFGGAAFIHQKDNKQIGRAKELGLKVISYPEGIGKFISKEENIEVVGNHGKTTITGLIAKCLIDLRVDPSYFIGGYPIGFESTVKTGNSKYSVCEGDEHPTLHYSSSGKFMYHYPKHVLFTSADWDHKNVFVSEKEYINQYIELFSILPKDGIITACATGVNVFKVLKYSKRSNPISLYLLNSTNEDIPILLEKINAQTEAIKNKIYRLYIAENAKYLTDSTKFNVRVWDCKYRKFYEQINNKYEFSTNLMGKIGVENSLAAISTLNQLGFDLEQLVKPVSTFRGVKRKHEILHNGDYVLINDHAHSPIKIKSSLEAVRTRYKNNRIFTIFHVGQSALKERKTFEQLKAVFNLSNFVLIPRVIPDMNSEDPIFGKDYKDLISCSANHNLIRENVLYLPSNQELANFLSTNVSGLSKAMTISNPTDTKNVSRSSAFQRKKAPQDVVLIMSSGDISEILKIFQQDIDS